MSLKITQNRGTISLWGLSTQKISRTTPELLEYYYHAYRTMSDSFRLCYFFAHALLTIFVSTSSPRKSGTAESRIGSETVEMTLNHEEHLIQTRRLLLTGAVESSLLDLMKVILRSKGPFVSLRRTCMSFPSSRWGCDERLQWKGIFGTSKKVGKTNLIFKELPTRVEEELVIYDLNSRMYQELFDMETETEARSKKRKSERDVVRKI